MKSLVLLLFALVGACSDSANTADVTAPNDSLDPSDSDVEVRDATAPDSDEDGAPNEIQADSQPDGGTDTRSDGPSDTGLDGTSDTGPTDVVGDTLDTGPDAPPSDPILEGDAGELALGALPTLQIPVPESGDVLDVEVLSLVRDRVVLALTDAATVGEVNALAAALDARLIGTLPELGILVLAAPAPTPDLAWVARALALADASLAVEVAAPSAIEMPQVLPPGHAAPASWSWVEDSGWDWALHFVRAPAAWNLRKHLAPAASRPRVVVLDGQFNPHPDVTFDAATPLAAANVVAHGTEVAGVIAAHWDAIGIEGVMPVATTVHGRSARIFPYPAENSLAVLVGELAAARAAGVPLLVNMSLGHNLFRVNSNPDGTLTLAYQYAVDKELPGLGESFAEVAERTGRLMRRLSRYTDTGGGYDRWLMVCSAGNSNVTAALKAQAATRNIDLAVVEVAAKTNSGCAFAASEGDAHFISVEALATGGAKIADFSSRGGTIAAPGEAMGLLMGAGYGAGDGTSFASPLVLGAAAFLWSYHPGASFGDIRVALLASSRPGAGGSSGRLDLWSALAYLDAHGGPDLEPLLADVDDGTVDGLLRFHPNGDAATVVTADQRGDGCVDISDFRAMRDALFDVTSTAGYAPFGVLLAGLQRDQNGDGVTAFTAGLTERRHSRFDLDASGAVDDADLAILTRHFGTCRSAEAVPITEDYGAGDLAALMASVDLFLELPPGSGGLRVVAPGRSIKTIAAADVAARTLDNHLIATLPATACDGGLDLRVEREDGTVRTYATPSEDILQLGRDYFLSGIVASAVDRSTPLVHTHTGPNVYEAIIYASTGEAQAVADLEPPFLAAPTFADALGVRHSRVAAMGSGGRVTVVTDGVVRSWKIAGTSVDLVPVAWSADGQGLLLETFVGQRRLFWLDLVREASAEVAPDLGIGDAWAQVVDGFVYFVSQSGGVYRAPTHARDDDWSASVLETAQCGLDYALPEPERVVALTDFGSLADVSLPRAYPGAVSGDGRRLAFSVRGAGSRSLRVLSLQGSDAGTSLTVASAWSPRGGFETFNLDASDGVAWSPDGSLFAYATEQGVYLATLGTAALPATLGTPIKVHDAPASIAFDPSGVTLLAVTTEGPVQARLARAHVYRAPWGGPAAGIYLHEHRHGAVVMSANGLQIAVVEKDGSKGNVVVYAPPSMSPVSTTATWADPCGAASCTTTSEILPAWARDVLPW